ncbi:glycosyltransferase family 39 protein [Methanococcoides seepicolus]|uniref:Glycosyltransferase family 39 protein n=1 Tax=Methanococcoides seepicolus TaxID=2828780 RepID=A0A9E5DCC1_9EURY|nr:glycosyltransferase family 39 protein [Methanococcoides seepicolus]MCM1987208.1 glycosyltransferase family 39 protein [Methanococcoides seepicolus]
MTLKQKRSGVDRAELKVALLIGMITVVGFLLRFYHLGDQSLWLDEAISSNAAAALLQYDSPVFPSGHIYGRAILNTYLIALSYNIFGVSEFAGRLPSVIFGTLTIPIVYFIGAKLENRNVGILASIFIAFSVWEIMWSRQARMYQQLQFFYLASILLIYEFNNNRTTKNFVLLVICILGAMSSHLFGYVLIPMALIYFLIGNIDIAKRIQIESIDIRPVVLSLAILLVLIFATDLTRVISQVFNTRYDYFGSYIYFLEDWVPLFFYLAPLGAVMAFEKRPGLGTLLILSYMIPFYFISFHVKLLGFRYLYFIFPILVVFSSLLIIKLTEHKKEQLLPKLRFPNTKVLINSAIIILLLLASVAQFQLTPEDNYKLEPRTPQAEFKEAYNTIKTNMGPDDAIMAGWTPLAQYYIGKCDYWLAFPITGTGIDDFLINNTQYDVYANATAIRDVRALEDVINAHTQGWIVVDDMTQRGIRPEMRSYLSNDTIFKVESYDSLKVYRWNLSLYDEIENSN